MAVESVVTIDIGAASVKLAEFEVDQRSITLTKFGFAEYDEIQTEDNRVDLLTKALRKLKAESGIVAKKAHISLSAQMAFTKFVKLPPVGDDLQKIKQVVEFEARQNVPFEMNEVIWDYQLISTEADTEIEVMFVAIKNDVVEGLVEAVEEEGFKVDVVDIATSSSYNAIRVNKIGQDECAMVLSIGARCSNLIFADGTHFFSRNIPIAGHAVTQQIAKEFGIGNEEAEELKRRHGFVALGGAYEEPESEVAATISKIVRNVMTRLHGEISRSINIYKSQQKGNKPVRLYLSGGSSTMLFTENFFQEKMKVDVKYFNPFQNGISLGAGVNRQELAEKAHLFSEVIGLILRVSECPVEISLTPDSVKRSNASKAKMPFNYATAVAAMLIPVVILAGSFRERMHYKGQIAGKQAEIKKYKQILDKIESQKAIELSVAQKSKTLEKFHDKRYEWMRLLDDLNKYKPQTLWISSLESKAGKASSVRDSIVKKSETTAKVNKFHAAKSERDTNIHKSTKNNEVGAIIISGYYVEYPAMDGNSQQRVLTKLLEDITASDLVLVKPDGVTAPKRIQKNVKKSFAEFDAQIGVKNIGRVD